MKKKIFLAVLLAVFLGAVAIGAQTVDQALKVKSLVKKFQNLNSGGIAAYPPPPSTLEIADEEINAGLSLLCKTNQLVSVGQKLGLFASKDLPVNPALAALPCQFFSDFKIKFGTGEYSATARLLKPISGSLSVKGKIVVVGERNIRATFTDVHLDGQIVPAETLSLLENTVNQEMNKILDRMKTVLIESAEISPGKITIKGIFSLDELLCGFGINSYCPPTVTF